MHRDRNEMMEKAEELAVLNREVMEWLDRLKANPGLYRGDEYRMWAERNVSQLLAWAEKSHAEQA